ncbi:MAG: hypothetical protein ACLVJ6_08660 [Merdibacter sp.]
MALVLTLAAFCAIFFITASVNVLLSCRSRHCSRRAKTKTLAETVPSFLLPWQPSSVL